jgi:hypothetical protein
MATKFDKHCEENAAHFKRVDDKLEFIVNEVSANGHKGLEASLKDIYGAVDMIKKDLHTIMEATSGDIARAAWGKATKELIQASPALRFVRTRVGKGLVVIFLFVIVNGILHTLGIPADAQGLLVGFMKIFGFG